MQYSINYHIVFSSESVTQSHALTNTIRGYTGHEHLPHFALINMNGRMYDPVLGRMLSPDNYVQDPNNAQNYNRYTYVLNNPLKYVDPSGEFIFAIVATIVVAGYDLLTNNWQGWEGSGKKATLIGLAIYTGGLGAEAISHKIMFANTVATIETSAAYTAGNHILNNGASDLIVSYGIGSFNFSTGKSRGLWNWNDLSGMEKFGYISGLLVNISDVYAITHHAYGEQAEDIEGEFDNHAILKKDDEILMDYGVKENREVVAEQIKKDPFSVHESTTDYRNYQKEHYKLNNDPSIFNRTQKIHNVSIDKIREFKNTLSQSGRGYKLFSFIGGKNINCAVAAEEALLHSGVFIIPTSVPGLLSAQLYVRNYMYMNYFFQQ